MRMQSTRPGPALSKSQVERRGRHEQLCSFILTRSTPITSLQRERRARVQKTHRCSGNRSSSTLSASLGKVASSVEQGLKEFEVARPRMLAQGLAAAVGCLFYQGHVTTTLLGRLLPPLPQVASTLCLLHALGSYNQRSPTRLVATRASRWSWPERASWAARTEAMA